MHATLLGPASWPSQRPALAVATCPTAPIPQRPCLACRKRARANTHAHARTHAPPAIDTCICARTSMTRLLSAAHLNPTVPHPLRHLQQRLCCQRVHGRTPSTGPAARRCMSRPALAPSQCSRRCCGLTLQLQQAAPPPRPAASPCTQSRGPQPKPRPSWHASAASWRREQSCRPW